MGTSKEQGTLAGCFRICNKPIDKCRRKVEKGNWKGIFLAKGEERENLKAMLIKEWLEPNHGVRTRTCKQQVLLKGF